MHQSINNNKGFTLVEIMIVVVISSLVIGAMNTIYKTFRDSTSSQEQVTDVQQTMRTATFLLTQELRTVGYDPIETRIFGITDVSFRDINNNLDTTTTGYSSLSYTTDLDEDGVIDGNETYSYSLYDFPIATPDGDTDLSRNTGGGRTLIAENVEAFGLAYAYDIGTDADRALDLAGGQVIWAIDSDNNGTLDRNLENNNDGVVDANDQAGAGSRLIAGDAIIPAIALANIRAIRMWLLVRSDRQDPNYFNNNTYVVGRNIIIPNDNFRRRLLEATVYCRNMGLL